MGIDRTLADLTLDTASLVRPGDFIQFDEDSSALFVQ